ncbi:MAG: hypothetical protein JXP34_01390, partial [Planctomycetes bacterium]|nr:hypothetical protein [Planctomycetota bacterium]
MIGSTGTRGSVPVVAVALLSGFLLQGASGGDVRFLRSDANADGAIDLADPIAALSFLFDGAQREIPCEAALDADGSGQIDIGDAIYTLEYLFADGPAPVAPFPEPGCDATPGGLPCTSYRDDIPCETTAAVVADHTTTEAGAIPPAWIEAARERFRIWYGHTSHG